MSDDDRLSVSEVEGRGEGGRLYNGTDPFPALLLLLFSLHIQQNSTEPHSPRPFHLPGAIE